MADEGSKYNTLPDPPTEKQKQVYIEFKDAVGELLQEHPEYQDDVNIDVSEASLYRFLRARNYSLSKSLLMFTNYAAWRHEFGSTKDHKNTLKRWGTYYILPKPDKFNRPVIVTRIKYHHPKKRVESEIHKEFVYLMEYICNDLMVDGLERLCVIVDFKDSQNKNTDLNLVKSVAQILQDYYPERLGCCFLVYNSWLFDAFWRAISLFLDKNTVAKVHFLGTSGYKKRLLRVIDEDNLPSQFGGTYEAPEPRNDPWGDNADFEESEEEEELVQIEEPKTERKSKKHKKGKHRHSKSADHGDKGENTEGDPEDHADSITKKSNASQSSSLRVPSKSSRRSLHKHKDEENSTKSTGSTKSTKNTKKTRKKLESIEAQVTALQTQIRALSKKMKATYNNVGSSSSTSIYTYIILFAVIIHLGLQAYTIFM